MDGIIICGVNLSLTMQKETITKTCHSSASKWIYTLGDYNYFYSMNFSPPATSLTHVMPTLLLSSPLPCHTIASLQYSKTGKERTSNWLCLQLTGDCKPPVHRVSTGGTSHINNCECSCVSNNLLVSWPKALNYSWHFKYVLFLGLLWENK